MGSSSNHMACLLKIESSKPGWEKSLEKLLSNNDLKFLIDQQNKTVYINGKIDPEIILQKITKAGKKAKIVWSNCGRPENRKNDHMMGQGNAMNAPPNGFYPHQQNQCNPMMGSSMNGFSNYHPNQGYYPPQLHPQMMNMQFPPHYQVPLPPPYTPLFHPHPPPPLPYEYHPNEPVAKLFPPTPPPPKNFVMGDLQSGCIIM